MPVTSCKGWEKIYCQRVGGENFGSMKLKGPSARTLSLGKIEGRRWGRKEQESKHKQSG